MSIVSFSQTVEIGGGRGRLTPAAAVSIRRVDKALGRALDINSAWRDPVLQQQLYDAYQHDPRNNPIALRPADSIHCRGTAADSDDGYNAAVIRVLNDHGWFQTVYRIVNGRRTLVEPWHFEYDASRDNHRNEGDPASAGAAPFQAKEIERESDMRTVLWVKNGTVFTFAPQQVKVETDFQAALAVRSVTGSTVASTKSGFFEVGDPEISALCESYGVPWRAIEATLRGDAYLIDGTKVSSGGRFWSYALEVAHGEKPVNASIDYDRIAQLVDADTNLQGIAQAVNDEADRRERERLGS